MVVQPRTEALRCIAQVVHGRLSGAVAAAWSTASRASVSDRLVDAIARHDDGWAPVDRTPIIDPRRSVPYDFMTLPVDERIAIYATGIDALEASDPLAATLASMHFSAFVDASTHPEFAAREAARRERLAADPATAADGYGLLQQLDLLSLLLCLRQPGSDADAWPRWSRTPVRVDGVVHTLEWHTEWEAALVPSPLRAPVVFELAYVDLPRTPFESQRALLAAWDAAPRMTATLMLA